MALNNPTTSTTPPPSQVAAQSIQGSHQVQAPPANSGVVTSSGSIGGGSTPYTYNQNKTKGNNPER